MFTRSKETNDRSKKAWSSIKKTILDFESRGVLNPAMIEQNQVIHLFYRVVDNNPISSIGHCILSDPLTVSHREEKLIIVPEHSYESKGIEDPRISTIEGLHLLAYTTFDDTNALRIKPEIQIASVSKQSDLNDQYWKDYFLDYKKHIAQAPKFTHEASCIGAGCPPIETAYGWVSIYHGVRENNEGYIYSACVALLALNDPKVEIARLPYPLFIPDNSWEKQGEVDNVCFPTGSLLIEDILYIYYGAADKIIACASLNFPELILELIKYK